MVKSHWRCFIPLIDVFILSNLHITYYLLKMEFFSRFENDKKERVSKNGETFDKSQIYLYSEQVCLRWESIICFPINFELHFVVIDKRKGEKKGW